jgi:ADP-heptose:LPS heptosyltransferase
LISLKFFFDNYFINSEVNSQYENFSAIINYLNIKVPEKINYYNGYKFKKNNYNLPSNFTLLHLDEKWFEGYYYSDFNYMNLNINNFKLLIDTLFIKFDKSIVLTSGKIRIAQFALIKKKFFTKIRKNIFISYKFKKKLILIDNTDFRDLEQIVKKSNNVICCEGAISHVSNAFNKNTFALINSLKTAKFWTNHMNNVKLLKRDNMTQLCKKIILT